MDVKRLITTGCSFTNHLDPTWPMFLSPHFDQTFNFGRDGAGNDYIFHSLIEADRELGLCEQDTVIIAWSSHTRFDKLGTAHISDQARAVWHTNGDIGHWRYGDQLRLQDYVTEPGMIMRTYNHMQMAHRYLSAKRIPFLFTSLNDLRVDGMEHVWQEAYQNFVWPLGINTQFTDLHQANQQFRQGDHPGMGPHHFYARGLAKALGVDLDHTLDLQYYDRLIGSDHRYHQLKANIVAHPDYAACVVSHRGSGIAIYDYLQYGRTSLATWLGILQDIFGE